MEDEYVEQNNIIDHEEIVEPVSNFDPEESRQIRSEQDKEFAESLEIDQKKVVNACV